jgi:hypothetical protein
MLLLIREPRPFAEELFVTLLDVLRSIVGKHVTFSDVEDIASQSAPMRTVTFCNTESFQTMKEYRAGSLWFTYQFRTYQKPCYLLQVSCRFCPNCVVVLSKQVSLKKGSTDNSNTFKSLEIAQYELLVVVGSLDQARRQAAITTAAVDAVVAESSAKRRQQPVTSRFFAGRGGTLTGAAKRIKK